MTDLWIWGRRPILEAIRAGTARRVLLASGRAHATVLVEIWEEAKRAGVPVAEVPLNEIERVAPGQVTQGVAAQVVERSVRDIDDLLSRADGRDAFIVALDQIQDPHNLGAILRTANGAGAQGIVIPKRHSAPISGIVAKTSAGALSHTAILHVGNLAQTLDRVKKAGVWVIGLDGSARTSLYEADLTVPLAMLVGAEGSGLRRVTREHCDLLVYIPMFGAVESLNASVAASIFMYEVVRQRLASTPK